MNRVARIMATRALQSVARTLRLVPQMGLGAGAGRACCTLPSRGMSGKAGKVLPATTLPPFFITDSTLREGEQFATAEFTTQVRNNMYHPHQPIPWAMPGRVLAHVQVARRLYCARLATRQPLHLFIPSPVRGVLTHLHLHINGPLQHT